MNWLNDTSSACRYEKFVGGMYLGELVRQILKLLTERGQLFGGEWPASLRGYKSFKPGFLCEIDRDPPHNFYSTEFLLKEDLKIHNLTPEDVHIVRYVCDAVIYRAACLAASGKSCWPSQSFFGYSGQTLTLILWKKLLYEFQIIGSLIFSTNKNRKL